MSELITLADAKLHLRKTTDDEDELISSFIAAAQQWVAAYTSQDFDPLDVPAPINQAMLLLVGQWYQQRGSASPDSFAEVPFAVTSLCRPFRGAVLS